MATKPQKPIFPMGIETEDASILQGFQNTGLITHTSDAVMQVPVSDDADIVDPSAVRYNADTDEFEGSYSDGWRALGGGGTRWAAASSPTNTINPEVGRGYFIDSRTRSALVILPSAPKRVGLSISFADLYGNLSVYPMTIDGNGKKIYGGLDQMVLHTDNAAFTLTWTGDDQGWIVTAAVGIGSGRTYRRNVFETTLKEDTKHLDLGTVPEMVDIYLNGARLPESGYKLVVTGVDFTATVPSGTLISVLEYKPFQLMTDGAERIDALESLTTVQGQDISQLKTNILTKAKAGANTDITSISGLTTPLDISQGGLGGASLFGSRKNLGVDFSETKAELIAHRGFGGLYPENTMIAFRSALLAGADSLECDVSLTSDGNRVVIHDTTVDRTSNGTGTVSNLTLSYLRSLDFGSKFSAVYAGERIPLFSDLLAFCKVKGVKLYPEIKNIRTIDDVNLILADIVAAEMEQNVVVQAFDITHLQRLRTLNKNIPVGVLFSTVPTSSDYDAIQALGNVYLLLNYSVTTQTVVSDCKSRGIKLALWTVDKPSAKKAMNLLGVNKVMSNYNLNKGA